MTESESAVMDKNRIRYTMRQKRAELSSDALHLAATNLAKQAAEYTPLLTAKKIASYVPANGEISPLALHKASTANFFFPRITNYQQSTMAFYCASNQLERNRFNILEPVAQGDIQTLKDVDVILLPLLAFDKTGNRLGMGGGFYDRALAFKENRSPVEPPHLIGLAHQFQKVEQLPAENWDIPLDAILTDKQLITIRR